MRPTEHGSCLVRPGRGPTGEPARHGRADDDAQLPAVRAHLRRRTNDLVRGARAHDAASGAARPRAARRDGPATPAQRLRPHDGRRAACGLAWLRRRRLPALRRADQRGGPRLLDRARRRRHPRGRRQESLARRRGSRRDHLARPRDPQAGGGGGERLLLRRWMALHRRRRRRAGLDDRDLLRHPHRRGTGEPGRGGRPPRQAAGRRGAAHGPVGARLPHRRPARAHARAGVRGHRARASW